MVSTLNNTFILEWEVLSVLIVLSCCKVQCKMKQNAGSQLWPIFKPIIEDKKFSLKWFSDLLVSPQMK